MGKRFHAAGAPRAVVAVAAALAVAALLAFASGCVELNRPLNSLKFPAESRVKNHTRAAIGAKLLPQEADADARGGDDQRHIRPATESGQTPANVPGPSPVADADGYFVGLAISGGGSRSANFAAASMFELQRLGILQRVDYISSVSGGSLTAAYYCTHGEEWNPQDVQRKLTYSFATDVLLQTITPWNVFALMFTSVDRTDLLANSFSRVLFRKEGRPLTYADLRDDRPRLLVNATDLQSGKPFVFSNEAFDEINSDLSKFPIARAVAASSAVPVLLHQLTLQDHSTTFNQYRHLIDGGVADNLGAKTLVSTFAAHVEQARLRGEPDPYPNGAVLIFLDATVEFDARLSNKRDVPFLESLVAGAGLSTTSMINRAQTATIAELIVNTTPDDAPASELRAYIRKLKDTGTLTLRSRTRHEVSVVHIALSQVDSLTDVPFMSFRERVNNIATYFNIDRTEAYHLYQAAELLVKQRYEPELIRLRDRMNGAASAATHPATQMTEDKGPRTKDD